MRSVRISAWVLAMLLTCSPLSALAVETDLLPARRAAPDFSDTAGTAYEEAASVVYEAGVMNGFTVSRFAPEEPLMPEQLAAVCARLYDLLTGGSGAFPAPAEDEAWYDPYYRFLEEALDNQGESGSADDAEGSGPVVGTEEMKALPWNLHPGKYPVLRWMLAAYLDQTLEAAGVMLPQRNDISVLPDAAGQDGASILRLCRAGIFTGTDPYGTFRQNDVVTRGEAAVILARVLRPALRESYSILPFDLCADVLGVDGKSPALTVEGETISMEQFAQELCLALRQNALESPDAPEQEAALAAAVEEIQEDVAIDRLAAKHHLLMSERKISDTYGSIPAGYQGVTREGWLWEYGHSLLHQELFLLYQAQSGPAVSDGETQGELLFNAALDAARPKDASLSPILTEMDWDAVLERLLSSPFRAL